MSKSILITGANRGIGLELSRQAALRGDTVTGTARHPENADAFHEVAAKHPGLSLIAADVTDPASLRALEEGAPIDLLICNAGQFLARGGIDNPDHTADAWQQVLMTNVAGVFFTIKAALPRLKAASNSKIAIISSRMGSTAYASGGSELYRASKAAATNLAANLAKDLEADGIAVGAYHPGWVQTDMGGSEAAVSATDSASGLLARFDHLSLQTSGCFEDFQGVALKP